MSRRVIPLFVMYEVGRGSTFLEEFLASKYGLCCCAYVQLNVLRLGKNPNVTLFYMPDGKFHRLVATPALPGLRLPSVVINYLLAALHVMITILKLRVYKADILYISSNTFLSWVGLLFRKINLVSRHVFMMGDPFFPLDSKDRFRRLASVAFNCYGKMLFRSSDLVWALSKSLVNLYQFRPERTTVQMLGCKPLIDGPRTKSRDQLTIGYIGSLTVEKGFGFILQTVPRVFESNPTIRLEVIGHGPLLHQLMTLMKAYPQRVKWWGVKPFERCLQIMRKWDIGIALYSATYDYLGDATKIKNYLSLGIPVIAMIKSPVAKLIEKFGAGVIIRDTEVELVQAIKTIGENYDKFCEGAFKLCQTLDYRTLYSKVFDRINV